MAQTKLEYSDYGNPLNNPLISPREVVDHFHSCLQMIAQNRKDYVGDPERDFIRNRVLTIPMLMKITIFRSGGSIQSELYQFFSGEIQKQCVTGSAYCQQRQKLSPKAFEAVFIALNEPFIDRLKTMNGYFIYAFDGTVVQAPDYFVDQEDKDQKGTKDKASAKNKNSKSKAGKKGQNSAGARKASNRTTKAGKSRNSNTSAAAKSQSTKGNKGKESNEKGKNTGSKGKEVDKDIHSYHISCLFDCINNLYLTTAVSDPEKKEEKQCLIDLLENKGYPQNSIILCDVGLEGWEVIAALVAHNQKFLNRIHDINSDHFLFKKLNLPQDKEIDMQLCILKKKDSNSKRPVAGYFEEGTVSQEEIEVLKEAYEIFKVRLVRLRTKKNRFESLLTNLTEEEFTYRQLRQLYNLRWSVETSFRSLKYHTDLVFFNARKEELIFQEIYACFIKYNLTSFLCIAQNIKQRGTKYKLKISFSDAVCNVRLCLTGKITLETLCERLSSNLVPERPGRSYSRNIKVQKPKPLNYRPK